jgi:putative addiction module component (TIGR02574 family)
MQISDLENLSTQEKLLAMEALWDSLCHENSAAIPSPEWHANELSNRYRALKNGEQQSKSWQASKEQLRKLTDL